MDISNRAINESEIVLYMLDSSRPPGLEEQSVAEKLTSYQDRLVVAINKIDAKSAAPQLYHDFLKEFLPELPESRLFEISCLEKSGTEKLLECLFNMAPEAEALYPEEIYTDQEITFRIAEIIREKAMTRLREELPHSIYVDIADIEQQDNRLWVRAFIITERESQKGMIVGKGGEKIKAIGQAARKELNTIFPWKVDLDLRVKTGKDWRHNDKVLKKITGN